MYSSNYESESGIIGIIFSVIILSGIFFGFIYLILTVETDETKFKSGKITEEQYCDTFKNQYQMPIRCYKYYGVHAVGAKQVGKQTVMNLQPD